MMRSGGHGLIDWLAPSFSDGVHINNYDPEISFMDHRMAPWKFGFDKKTINVDRGPLNSEIASQFTKISERHISCFLYSCEDYNPDWMCQEVDTPKHYRIILLRDPFNCFASRLKGFNGIYPRYPGRLLQSPLKLWKQHAKTILTDSDVIPVLFDKWLLSEDYRRSLADSLGIPFNDSNFGIENRHGGGSSFPEDPFNLLQRWKHFQTDPYYLSLFDKEMLELSNQLFPDFSCIIKCLKL